MSYERSKAYREFALIEGINLLVNMTERTREDKEELKKIHETWMTSGMLSFADQIELIYGTATDKIRCRYMVFCINQFNGYMMSKYPNHVGLMRSLSKDILNAINMAIYGDIHIWKKVQLQSIESAFKSGRVAKPSPFFEPPSEDEEKEYEKHKKRQTIEYKPNGI